MIGMDFNPKEQLMKYYIGIDIGGTKCAVVLGDEEGKILEKRRFPTTHVTQTLANIQTALNDIFQIATTQNISPSAIGISCGGPLDAQRGIIQAPPNLPDWVDIPIVSILEEEWQLPTYLCNDANACALAEWKFGAGKGSQNMIFMTFGTGMGAGLILDGKLYAGTTGDAGEIGHVRLSPNGPMGYRKFGSVEGFCSGGGLAQLGQTYALQAIQEGYPPIFCPDEHHLHLINAQILADAARTGDEVALRVWHTCGEYLGRTLAILIDLFNPERIVIGSIYQRAADLLIPAMRQVLEAEALPTPLAACQILPAALTESVGDLAALTVAMQGHRQAST